ncbi:tape measure protein [Enterococcus cecorum]|uniref:tape measure protein n=1 Tax=Enterococcus cecorum TaxID=44008 RepID=UPI002ACA3350|nr:tape measure protein [Enterococcus cecorum]MDZ5503165.1 tape measure protein [Enterococcus cecorum]MDZ5557018.1 tape measure protein [Enterococcus cecorum]MDZ5559095.1 tape measure protein [Enterococcus cecorum]MDZ5592037.1 tape measure protein [Enterococcus cecorum]
MADGKVTIKAIFDGKQAEGEVSKLKSVLNGLGNTGNKIGSVFKSVLGANLVSSAITTTIGSITSGVHELYGELNGSNKAWQTFEGNMSMLGKSAEEISNAKKAMQDYATQTIYSASDMAQTYSQLAAVGIKGTDKLVTGFGGLAAAAENPQQAMKTLSQQAVQMAAKPTVAWQDFKLMLEQTPAGISAVAKEMGMSTSEMVTAVQDGTIKTEDFFNAIQKVGNNEHFAKMATQFKSIDQAIDGAKETLSNKLMPAFEKFNQFGIKVVEQLTNALDKIDFGKVADKVGKFLDGVNVEEVFSKIGSIIDNTVSKVKTFFNAFAQTGAIQAFLSAMKATGAAIKHVYDSLTTNSNLKMFGTILGTIVKWLSIAAQAVGNFISKLDSSVINKVSGGLLALVVGFKALNFLKGFNPFAIFSKNAEGGMNNATKSVSKSKGLISQLFTGLANVIKSTGQAINNILKGVGVAAKGLGQGLASAFKGIGAALRMLNPAQIISFGAAVGVAAIGIGAGIAIIAAGFTLLATQSQGIATIIQAVSVGFGTFASMLIGAVANAIVTVSAVLPTIAQSMVILTPVIYAVASAFRSILEVLPPVITAFGTAISSIITAITPIVSIIASTFESVVQIVADAIVRIVQALAPFIPEVTKIVQALAPVIQSIIESFNNLVNQISPILDSLTNLIKEFGTQVKNILDGVSDVVESVGGVIERALQGVAGIFDSIGNAALNAGKGFKQFAQGVKMLVDLKLGDLIGTLTATAKGVSDIAASAEGLASAGRGMQQFGQGMMLIQTAGTVISTVLTSLANSIPIVVNSITMLGPAMITASVSMTMFATSVTTMATSMTGVVANFLMFSAGLVGVQSSIMMIVTSLTMLNAIIAVLGGVIGIIPSQFNAISTSASGALNTIRQLVSTAASVSAGFANLGSTASSAMNALSSSVKSAVSQSVSVTKSGMQAMTSAIQSASSKMIQIATQTGQNVASKLSQGILSGSSQAKSAMSSLMSAVRSAGVSGASQMTYVGRMIGEGVARGMRQALGSVTAAANAIIEQANRAAQAKAQIHSPSRLFAKTVGQFIPAGVGMGIENNIGSATDSIKLMIDKMSSYQFNPEDILTGNGSFTRRVALKASGERLISYNDESRNNQEKWSQKVLDAIDNVANRPTYVVLDDGTLVGKIVDPITDLQSQKDKIKRAVWGLGFE